MVDKVDSLSYVVLPRRIELGNPHVELYNAAYGFWKGFWSNVMEGLNLEGVSASDDFFRHDLIAMLMQGDEIVGMHCYSLFDLRQDATRDLSYLTRYYSPEYFAALANANKTRLMSLEYLGVAPGWRASAVGVSLATVLVTLGLKLAAQLGVDAGIGAARADVPVDKICQDHGATLFGSPFLVHGKPTQLVVFPIDGVQGCADAKARALAARLWSERSDSTAAVAAVPVNTDLPAATAFSAA